jgi:hypothetical protein
MMTLDALRLSPDDVLLPHADPQAFAQFVEDLNAHADRGEWSHVVARVRDAIELPESPEGQYLRAAILLGTRFWTSLGVYASTLRLQYRANGSDPGLNLTRLIRQTHAVFGFFGERRAGRPVVRAHAYQRRPRRAA